MIQPPWTLRDYLESALILERYRGEASRWRYWSLVLGGWQDFDRMQREDWREYQASLREQMRERVKAV